MRARVVRHWPVLPALVLYALTAAALRRFVTDDALITLRYARQVANGHGVVWNAGEDPVEGFTNFSHVVLGALALRLNLPALTCLRAINVLATFGLILLTYDLARRVLGSRAWAAIAALLVGVHPALAYWSVSGLETSVYACALLLGVWALHLGNYAGACGAFLAASLTRFEGPAPVVAVLGIQLVAEIWQRRIIAPPRSAGAVPPTAKLARVALCTGAFCVVYAAYFAWRYHYFGYPLSNSAYYKATGSDGQIVHAFVDQNAALLVLVAFAPLLRMGALGWQLLAIIATYMLGFYRVQPSISHLHRFLLPVFAPAVLLAVATLQRVWSMRSPFGLTRYASAVLLVCAAVWDLGHSTSGLLRTLERSETRGGPMPSRARVAAFIAGHYPRGVRVLAQDVGVIGYALLNRIDDSFGLNDEAMTHRFAQNRAAYIDFELAKQPDLIVLISKETRRFIPYYYTDRRIAQHAELRRDYQIVKVVASVADAYHYVIFARRTLAQRPDPIEIAVDEQRDLGLLIDDVATRSWAAQRTRSPEQHLSPP
jgi:arabinofuranosyltransferase